MIAALFLVLLATAPTAENTSLTAAALAKQHESHRFVMDAAPCLTPPMLAGEIDRLVARHPRSLTVEIVGSSFLGKDIRMISIGHGPKSILLWSQMHGDEATATPALLDLADFLAREDARPEVAKILDSFTLRMIPMLNPDGAARYERRNAQGIDINRDALRLTTPEGRLLKSIRDRFSPVLGFNLHDQNRRTMVGQTGVLSSISLLAVAGDEKGTLTPGRMRAKRVASRIFKTLSPFIPGGIARYDEDWNPRAFGDNVTAWGSPVVLIESGAFPAGGGFGDLTRLNFVALVSILDGLARNDLADETPDAYDGLLRNQSGAWADVAIIGALTLAPRAGTWFTTDLAFDILTSDQALSGCAPTPPTGSRIVEIGDSRLVTPGRKIDGRGLAMVPLSKDHGLRPGEITSEAIFAIRPGAPQVKGDPLARLEALRLSDGGLGQGGAANFVLWIKDPKGEGAGRYFVVIDGVGLPDELK